MKKRIISTILSLSLVAGVIFSNSAMADDFMEAVAYNRNPISGFDIAYDTARLTYAAYMSAELNRRVIL